MPSKTIKNFVDRLIKEEIDRAILQHGEQVDNPDWMWALIAGEEMGEIHQAILQSGKLDDLIVKDRVFDEVKQLAAVTTHWLQLMEERAYKAGRTVEAIDESA